MKYANSLFGLFFSFLLLTILPMQLSALDYNFDNEEQMDDWVPKGAGNGGDWKIEDGELNLNVNTGKLVQANIRNYSIEIDAERKLLKHDCDDWRKGKDQKRICKHIVKLFLSLHPLSLL